MSARRRPLRARRIHTNSTVAVARTRRANRNDMQARAAIEIEGGPTLEVLVDNYGNYRVAIHGEPGAMERVLAQGTVSDDGRRFITLEEFHASRGDE